MLFRLHGWEPQKYFNMAWSERLVVHEFLVRELKDIQQEQKGALNDGK